MINQQELNYYPTLEVPLVVSTKNNMPCIGLRKEIVYNVDEFKNKIVKWLIHCALNNQPIIITPTVSNKIQSINSLMEKGIIYKDKKDGEYKFTL